MDKQKLQKVAKLLDFEREHKINPAIAIFKENEKIISAVSEVEKDIEVIQHDSIKLVEAINDIETRKADRKEVKELVESIPVIKGDRGYKGEPGNDYVITDKDYKAIASKVEVPVVEKIVETIIKEQPIIKTEIVKEIIEREDLAPEQIRDRLELLKDDERLDAKAIKGLPELDKRVTSIQAIAGRPYEVIHDDSLAGKGTTSEPLRVATTPASAFTDLTDTFSSYTGLAGQGLRVNATEDGIDTYTAVDTDEKVKYDASDPTAGYVADKIIAGTGISVAEGTGGDANKLVITNSNPDQTVAISGGTGISVTGVYPSFTVDSTITQYTDEMAQDAVMNNTISGTGILASYDDSLGTLTIDNTAPDQTVSITAGTGIDVTGIYPNFTVTNTVADTDALVKVSANDTTAGYLNGKLVAGTGISLTENNNGGDETLSIDSTITQYTDELAQDAVGNAVGNGLDYDDITGAISVDESELSLPFLKLDQTTPEAVTGGSPIMEGIQFDTTPSTSNASEGLLRWNATDGTLDLGMSGGNITQQIGQELFIKVWNDTGVLIPNGTPVYFNGRQGNRPKVIPARSDAEATSMVMGLTTQDLEATGDGREGFITTFGYVRQIKTNYSGTGIWGTTWVEGDKLYVSKTDAGTLTNVEPDAPHHADCVGEVAIVGGPGVGAIFVQIDRHKTLEELADIDGTALTTDGQFPVWNQTAGYFDFDKNINDYEPEITGSTANTVWHGNKIFSPVVEADISLSDNATNNATTLRHGFLPKLSGNAVQFLDGAGNYSTPTAGAANSYTLVSFSGQTSVNVIHNFSTYPNVQVIDSLGAVEIPLSITHNTVNDFTVTFTNATTGNIVATVGSPQPQSVIVVNSDYTVLDSDEIIQVTTFNSMITLPTSIGNTGRKFTINNTSSGNVFVDTTSSQTISGLLTQTIPAGSSMSVYADGSNYYII